MDSALSAPTATTALPTADETAGMVNSAQRLFHRSLAAWASDLLALRQAGLDGASWQGSLTGPEMWSQAA